MIGLDDIQDICRVPAVQCPACFRIACGKPGNLARFGEGIYDHDTQEVTHPFTDDDVKLLHGQLDILELALDKCNG